MNGRYDPARLSAQCRRVRVGLALRVMRSKYATKPLSAVPTPSRFSDPAGVYAVLCASTSLRCSFWEAVVRGRSASL